MNKIIKAAGRHNSKIALRAAVIVGLSTLGTSAMAAGEFDIGDGTATIAAIAVAVAALGAAWFGVSAIVKGWKKLQAAM